MLTITVFAYLIFNTIASIVYCIYNKNINLIVPKKWCLLYCIIDDFSNLISILCFRYAGLYFCICVDISDNNLFYLEAIHNFVEVRVIKPPLILLCFIHWTIFLIYKCFIFILWPHLIHKFFTGVERIFPQCLWARSGVQFLQGNHKKWMAVSTLNPNLLW